jgi:hypothetical protein
MGRSNGTGYSATVDMKLRVDGELYDVVQSCSDMVFLSEEHCIQKGFAELIITIDGEPQSHDVFLLGADEPTKQVRFW